MIPIHNISEDDKKDIKLNELVKLTHYDSTEAHRHNYFEFFVFFNGGGSHLIDFERFQIESYSIHIVSPGQVHQVQRELQSNGFVFLFELNLFNSNKIVEDLLFNHICLDVKEFSPIYHFSSEFQKEIENLMKNIWIEYNSENSFIDQLIFNQLSYLLLHCARQKNLKSQEIDPKSNNIYISFRRLLNQEFKNFKKVKEYASFLNITEKSLNEIVLQKTGLNTSSLIYNQLILEAKRLLKTGIHTKEVAYELNFNDPAHFSKFFKTQTGFSPSDFQKMHEFG